MLEHLRRIEQLETQVLAEKQELGRELREKFEELYKLACQKLDRKDLFKFGADDYPSGREKKLFFPTSAFFQYPGFDDLPSAMKFHLRQEYNLISLGEEDPKEFFNVIFAAPRETVDFYYLDINHWRIKVSLKNDRMVPYVAVLDEEQSRSSLFSNRGWIYTEASSDNEAYLWTIQNLDLVD